MSRLDKLQIQGIRSFGPEYAYKMELFTPLTLILGPNGCGKTTIIEALKYITTGELPPGCGRGASFVHNPKMTKESMVRGQIKLKFRSGRGEEITAVRSIEATQKKQKVECKTLDATITVIGPDGEPHHISRKCADFQVEMSHFLGVSKAILENVIFCHQEDCNWPLDEGKKVKDKFDAIFNATRYIKCLDTIRKQRDEEKHKVSNLDILLKSLKDLKEIVVTKKKELTTLEEQKQKIAQEQQELKTSLDPIRERLREIYSVEKNVGSLQGDLDGKRHKLSSTRDMQKELRLSMKESISCSDDELFRRLVDFETQAHNDEMELRKAEEELRQLERDTEKTRTSESRELKLVGQLEAQHQVYKSNMQSRNQLLKALVSTLNMEGHDYQESFDEEESDIILTGAARNMDQQKDNMKVKKRGFEGQEQEIQEKIDELRLQEATLEHDIQVRGKQLDELSRKIRSVRQMVQRNEYALFDNSLESVKENLNNVSAKIEEEEKKLCSEEVAEEIEGAQRKKAQVELKLRDLKGWIMKMNRQSEARSQYDIYVKEKSELQDTVSFLKRKHEDTLKHLLGRVPGDNLRSELDAYITSLRDQLVSLNDHKAALSRKKTEIELGIKNDKHSISVKDREVRDFQDMFESVCPGLDLEAALTKCKNLLDLLSKEKSELSNSVTGLQGHIEKLKARDCCPLCHRDFVRKSDVVQLIEELEEKIGSVPRRLVQVTAKYETQEKLYEKLHQLKPRLEQIKASREQLQSLRSGLSESFSQLDKVSNDLEEMTFNIDVHNSDEEVARELQPDILSIDSHVRKIALLSEKIDDIKATLGSGGSEMTMDEALRQQSSLEKQERELSEEVDKKRDQLIQHKESLQRLKDRKVELSTKHLELRMKEQESEKLKEDLNRMESEKQEHEKERDEGRARVATIKYQVQDAVKKKTEITKDKDSWMEKESTKISSLKEEWKRVSDIHDSIKAYVSASCEESLSASRSHLQELKRAIEVHERRKKEIMVTLNTIQKSVNNKKERRRALEVEKKIRDKEVEAKLLEQEIAALMIKIKDFNFRSLITEREELQNQESKVHHKNSNLTGQLEVLNEREKELKIQLRKKEALNAEKNYQDALVDLKCRSIVCEDLNKYYKALDTAIMKFHSEKMLTINRILRELWHCTYRGNDIDYIQIKTDDSESQGADKRRTYHYRVVMVKNDTEMDMRGRCSAGQKVLASLLIRMALAQTFSKNCGILSLDEPTTNLDRDNIKALEEALLGIVNSRDRSRNMQLIIITHDEEFLQSLARADNLHHFYSLSRNDCGLSVITPLEVKHG